MDNGYLPRQSFLDALQNFDATASFIAQEHYEALMTKYMTGQRAGR